MRSNSCTFVSSSAGTGSSRPYRCRLFGRGDAAEAGQTETDELARSFGVRVLRGPREVDRVRRELEEYLEGRRHTFDLPLDLRGKPGFSREILDRLARVPTARSRRRNRSPSRPAIHAPLVRSARS